jgi:hypothetical protein
MMTLAISTTQPAAVELEQLEDKLLGYPAKGVHVGGGIHVPMPATWDGTGKPPMGWTSYRTSSIKHPTLSQWATPLDAKVSTALAGPDASKLTAAEKTKLAAADATAVTTLPEDWAGAKAAPTGVK